MPQSTHTSLPGTARSVASRPRMSPSPPKLLEFEMSDDDPRRCLAPAGRPPLPPTPTPITSGPSASTSDQSSVLMLLIALAHESERVCPPPPRRRLASGQGLTLVHFSAQREHLLWDPSGA